MFYLIDSIRVVKRGRWVSFRRNEVTKVISLDSAKTWMNAPEKTTPIQAGGGADEGTQRNMLALQNVEYLIAAEVRITPLANRPEDKLEKYLAEIERRARGGKCFHRPGLGMREFAADFEWESDPDAAHQRRLREVCEEAIRDSLPPPGSVSEDLGLMLYDVFDHRERAEGFRWLRDSETSNVSISNPPPKGRAKKTAGQSPRWTRPPIIPEAAFFHAKIESSCMDCHPDRVHILTPQTGGN
jgi:CRISPR-associated protein Cas5d